MVKDISVGGSYPFYYSLTAVGNKLCFLLFFNGEWQLWESDGTPKGTYRIRDAALKNVSIQQAQMVALGDQLFFSAFTSRYGTELWTGIIDQTAAKSSTSTQALVKPKITVNTAPNPFVSLLQLLIYSDQEQTVSITVSDLMGNTILNSKKNLYKGPNSINFETADWAAGEYLVTVHLSNGSTITRKIIRG